MSGDKEGSEGSVEDVTSEKLLSIEMQTEENGKGCCESGFYCFGNHKPKVNSSQS